MKKFIVLLALSLSLCFVAGIAGAADLITNPMTGVATYDVEVDGNVVPAMNAEADGSLKYNVDALEAGTHTFRVRPVGQGGWPADWSAPFVAVKPATADGLIIAP